MHLAMPSSPVHRTFGHKLTAALAFSGVLLLLEGDVKGKEEKELFLLKGF